MLKKKNFVNLKVEIKTGMAIVHNY